MKVSQFLLYLPAIFDVPLKQLDGKTPLEKAKAPHFKAFCEASKEEVFEVPKGCLPSYPLVSLFNLKLDSSLEAPLVYYALGIQGSYAAAYIVRFVASSGSMVLDVSDQLLSQAELSSFCSEVSLPFGAKLVPVEKSYALLLIPPGGPSIRLKQLDVLSTVGNSALNYIPFELRSIFDKLTQFLKNNEINALRIDSEIASIETVLIHAGGPIKGEERGAEGKKKGLFITRSLLHQGLANCAGMKGCRYEEKRRFDELKNVLQQVESADEETVIFDCSYLWDATFSGDLLQKIKGIEFIDREFIQPMLKFRCDTRLLTPAVSDIRTGSFNVGPGRFFMKKAD